MKTTTKNRTLPPVMIGTAGHVDHGKTSLVKILTGCDTDRLKEEKERGLSIDLGFAPCLLSGDRMVGIIDVPGHIDFIRNMVTGASSINILLLVIAADDGIMPQTVEHLQIISMLSSPRMIVALTKRDIVDPEMLLLAEEEIGDFLKDSGFHDVPIIPISNVTLEGVSALKENIEKIVDSLDVERDKRCFRMNIQKRFSVKGMGTVVTGIPLCGNIKLNDDLELLPSGRDTSVRAIQNYKQQSDYTGAGICCALNIRDIDEGEIGRGMTLVHPGVYRTSDTVIVSLRNSSTARFSIKHNASLKFHAGTLETTVKVSLIGTNSLSPGESGFAKFAFQDHVVLVCGDRFILRIPSPSMTIGGGRVIVAEKFRFKRSSSDFMKRLKSADTALEDNDFLASQLYLLPGLIYSREKLLELTALMPEIASDIIEKKVRDDFLIPLGRDFFLLKERVEDLKMIVFKFLRKYHDTHRYSLGIEPPLLGELFDIKKQAAVSLIKILTSTFTEFSFAHGRLALSDFSPDISAKQVKMKDALYEALLDAGSACMAKGSLIDQLGISEKDFRLLSNILIEENLITVLGKYYMAKHCFDICLDKFYTLAAENDVIDIGDYRDAIGTGRNSAVTILEKFDALGLTKRVDGGRSLIHPS